MTKIDDGPGGGDPQSARTPPDAPRSTPAADLQARLDALMALPDAAVDPPAPGALEPEDADGAAIEAEAGARAWGPFVLREPLGRGTFGTVYRAWQPALRRDVALKLLHEVAPAAALRLVAEARALARIRHENVVTIFDADVFDDEVGYWMELVRGRTLEDVLDGQGPCSAPEAILVGLDLCRALAAVHRAGILHCDVKAQNVMREFGGRIVLTDFGAAARIARELGWSARRSGTPLYLAPEVLEGAAPTVQSDIYGLGVLLYHLVSGLFPVDGASMAAIRDAHARQRRQRLRDVRPDLPGAFVHAIERATAQRPDDRPESMGALEGLLEAAMGRQTPAGRRSSRPLPRDVDDAASTIAVLPFVDMSDGRSLGYFCEGMAEEIINALTAVPGLRVIARGSAFTFRGGAGADDIRAIGSALNATTVLDGSVRAAGDRLRIIARLTDAHDGVQRWSARFDRRLENVFAVQDEIAAAVVVALGVGPAAGPAEAVRPAGSDVDVPGAGTGLFSSVSTPSGAAPAEAGQRAVSSARSGEAYALYLQGRFCWNQRTESALQRSAAYFEAAIAKDPEYPDAYAGLADAYTTLALYGLRAPDACLPGARAAAYHALELTETLPDPYASLGCMTAVYDWEWERAGAYYRRAVDLDPQRPGPRHWYAINYLVPLGRFDEADGELQQAVEADPLSTPIRVSGGILSYFAHRFDEAAERLRACIESDPGSRTARLFLGLTLTESTQYDEALRHLTIARQLDGSPEIVAALGYAAARAGDRRATAERLRELEALAAVRYVSPSLVAQVHAGLEDRRLAVEWLQRAFARRAVDLAWLAVRPVFDGLRSESEVARMLMAVHGEHAYERAG